MNALHMCVREHGMNGHSGCVDGSRQEFKVNKISNLRNQVENYSRFA